MLGRLMKSGPLMLASCFAGLRQRNYVRGLENGGHDRARTGYNIRRDRAAPRLLWTRARKIETFSKGWHPRQEFHLHLRRSKRRALVIKLRERARTGLLDSWIDG